MNIIFLIDPNENWMKTTFDKYYYGVVLKYEPNEDTRTQLTVARDMYLNEIAAFIFLSVVGGLGSFLMFKYVKDNNSEEKVELIS